MNGTYWLTRFVFLRAFGFIYLAAFLVASQQFVPLLGDDGIFPVKDYLDMMSRYYGPGANSYRRIPTLFWFNASDAFLQGVAYAGVGLSLVVVFLGADSLILFVLWFLYLSLVNAGQIFYGYGWETMVLETGFLTIFLAQFLSLKPFPPKDPPSSVVVWLFRWVLFRVMFGAALIKFRGDPCWRDLTCLNTHFETQPLPNPLSWYFHHLPPWALKGGVLFNHLAEAVAPWMIFGPRRIRHIGAGIIAVFQLTLILSGNLSWLNYLTLALCIPCFDDEALKFLFPKKIREKIPVLAAEARPSTARRAVTYALAGLVGILSIQPVLNLVSSQQLMNFSYNSLHLVNTYGAFGSITEIRREIVFEGSSDDSLGPTTVWKEYGFKCKPGDVNRRPCVVSPYHYRIDWQMWFAAMEDAEENPWLFKVVEKMLKGDRAFLSLLGKNPFPEKPPRFIRATLYEYHFTDGGEKGWWRRKRVGEYLPPLELEGDSLRGAM